MIKTLLRQSASTDIYLEYANSLGTNEVTGGASAVTSEVEFLSTSSRRILARTTEGGDQCYNEDIDSSTCPVPVSTAFRIRASWVSVRPVDRNCVSASLAYPHVTCGEASPTIWVSSNLPK